MIAIIGLTDIVFAQVTSPSSIVGGQLPCYCSWFNIGTPVPVAYEFTLLNPLSLTPQPIQVFPPGATAIEIREITISNVLVNVPPANPPTPPNTYAANVVIYIGHLIFAQYVYFQIYQCVLQSGETLSYNSTPGINGSWQIYDSRGQGTSSATI